MKRPPEEEEEVAPPRATEVAIRRRRFLGRLGLAATGAVSAALAVPIVGFVLAPVLRRPRGLWRAVGQIEEFVVGRTVLVSFRNANARSWEGATAKTGAWLRRRSQDDFLALSVDCTHLGCPVRWVEEAKLFMCPCHGGVYYGDGKVAAGPPPKHLTEYPVRIRRGRVEIRTEPLPIT